MIDALEQRLLDLGETLELPPTPDLAAMVLRRIAVDDRRRGAWLLRPRWQRRIALVAVALALVAAVVFGVEPVRTTVAHWLGVRGVEVLPVQTLPPVPARTPGAASRVPGASVLTGEPVSLDTARRRAGFDVQVPSRLGAPDAVWLDTAATSGQAPVVTLVYLPRPGLPEAGSSGVAVLVTELRGSIDSRIFGKFVGPGTTLQPLTVGGGQGYWIDGMHDIAHVDAGGNLVFDTLRLAGPTLLFEHGALTVRVEAHVDQATALGIAESLR